MTNEEKDALSLCIGLLEGIASRNKEEYSKRINLGIQIIKDFTQESSLTLDEEIDLEWNKTIPIDEGMGSEFSTISIEQFNDIVRHFINWQKARSPKFRVGEVIKHKEENDSFKILAIEDDCYRLENNIIISIAAQDQWELKWDEEDNYNLSIVEAIFNDLITKYKEDRIWIAKVIKVKNWVLKLLKRIKH